MKQDTTKLIIATMTSGLLSAVLVLGYSAIADQTQSPIDRTFGYEGTLEWDGAAYDGLTTMAFSLYPDDLDGTPACWTGTGTVDVRTGRFAVELGGEIGDPIDADHFDGPLYLGVEVQRIGAACAVDADCGGEMDSCGAIIPDYCDSPDDGLIALGNRQKITAVPYAMASTRANDFSVNGRIDVVGSEWNGNVSTPDGGGLRITGGGGPLTMDGDEIDSETSLYLQLNSRQPVRFGGNVLNHHGPFVVADDLEVTGSVSTPGSGGVVVSDNLEVTGSVMVSQVSTLNGSENNGAVGQGGVNIGGGSNTMILDGDEIETTGSVLHLNNHSDNPVRTGGNLEVMGTISNPGAGVVINDSLSVAGTANADALNVGQGSSIGRIMHGALGQCFTSGVPKAGSGGTVSFPSGFSNGVRIFLQVKSFDNAGCGFARVSVSNATGFTWFGYDYVGGNLRNVECDCLYWTAIDP